MDRGQTITNEEISIDDLSDHFCNRSFVTLASGSKLRQTGPGILPTPTLYACHCPGSVPYPVAGGQIGMTNAKQAWNGHEIKEIRRSILDGDLTYCHRAVCDEIVGDTLPKRDEITDPFLRDIIDNHRTHIEEKPTMITLGYDSSCTIAC